jgi:threonine aldolase
MHFFSDNAASVHPSVWAAMQAADSPDFAYDADALSRSLDEAFSALFGAPCTALWVATGTAANCLALSAMVPPHGAVVCHREAHIEMDEGGAPGLFLHGAKLLLAQGEGGLLTPETISGASPRSAPASIRSSPTPSRSRRRANRAASIVRKRSSPSARWPARGLGLHMDGARLANAIAHLDCTPAAVTVEAGVDALSFGFIKNGGLSAEAMVFDPALAERVRFARKQSGHLQSKGRYLAAQILALLEHDQWLANARAANAAAQELAGACAGRLIERSRPTNCS